MRKRLSVLGVALVSLTLAGCGLFGGSSCGPCASGSTSDHGWFGLRCEGPCWGKHYKRSWRQMQDFTDVYFLNYDRHDPYRCDPCIGD